MSSTSWQLDVGISAYHSFASDVIFSSEEADQINDQLSSKIVKPLKTSGGLDSSVRNTNGILVDPKDSSTKWIFDRINDSIVYVNREYYGYDLISLQSLDYLEYNVGQFYGKHIDVFPSALCNQFRKLSLSIQLTDPINYEGGDLLLYCDEPFSVADRDKGVGTFFPSYTLHEVTKVTSGIRHCLVGWITGPKLK